MSRTMIKVSCIAFNALSRSAAPLLKPCGRSAAAAADDSARLRIEALGICMHAARARSAHAASGAALTGGAGRAKLSTRCTSANVTRHTSHVSRHTSHVTRHTSHVCRCAAACRATATRPRWHHGGGLARAACRQPTRANRGRACHPPSAGGPSVRIRRGRHGRAGASQRCNHWRCNQRHDMTPCCRWRRAGEGGY